MQSEAATGGAPVRVTRRNGATWITIDRPHVMNAIDPTTAWSLREAIEVADRDPSVRAIVIAGAGGRAFSVGADLKWRANHPDAARDLPIGGGLQIPGLGDFACRAPLIAAVDGYALGGGFELVLACDFAVATDRSVFGLPEVSVGLVADAGGVHRLVRQLPWKLAMDVVVGGRRLTALEAKHLGIVNDVVAPEAIEASIDEIVNRIAAASPLAVRASKQTAVRGLDRPLDEVLNVRVPLHERLLASIDAEEGPRAFAERRPARWMDDTHLARALEDS